MQHFCLFRTLRFKEIERNARTNKCSLTLHISTSRRFTIVTVFPVVAGLARACVVVHEIRARAVDARVWAAVVDICAYTVLFYMSS